jgi:hypothetical protein
MVLSYAEQAVALGMNFKAKLDYSERSLAEVERILDHLAGEMPTQKPSTAAVAEMCKLWGCYLGEVVRRRWGGEWAVETYPGAEFATLALNVRGAKLFPSLKIDRRLTLGAGESIEQFFEMMKGRLTDSPSKTQ